jgi:Holliday junction resolvase RusA-like endonuclease
MRVKTYIINQPPIPWQRARLNGKNFFDGQTKEKLVYGIYLQQQHNDEPMFTRPIEMDLTFYMPKPLVVANRIKRDKTGIAAYHSTTPDLDNMVKFVLDAIQNVLISNDKLVYAINAKKLYGDEPRTEFTIKEA